MNKTLKIIGIATLLIGSIAATSPTYAASKSKPDMMGMDMMKGGKMGDMMGMESMMADMNKMMKLCLKMMESKTGNHMKG